MFMHLTTEDKRQKEIRTATGSARLEPHPATIVLTSVTAGVIKYP
jgi:ABC-type Fe2+-enterobactin transport system substrate-binding protein